MVMPPTGTAITEGETLHGLKVLRINGFGSTLSYPSVRAHRFFARDSSNVEVALRCFAQAKARLFKSGYKYMISLLYLVLGTGFEPVTFR